MKRHTLLALVLTSCAAPLLAQDQKPLADPAMAGLRPIYGRIKDIAVRAAEKMPEEHFAFKPTPEVKTFGQFVGHLSDANGMFCKMAMGEPFKMTDENEKTKTTKADLVKALKDSYALCDKAMALSDADLGKPMKFFGNDSSRFAAVNLVVVHGFEHYGNMVTYMRMKGLVPPSSEAPPAAPKAEDAKPAEKK